MEITVGADPEVFLTKKGRLLPSCDLIGGTKQEPKQITADTFVQEDNVTVEFNCKPVKYDSDNALWDSAKKSLEDVREYVKNLDKSYNLLLHDSANFGESITDVEKAWIFGCDPDFDAYEGGRRSSAIDPYSIRYTRFAGGHIHIGYDKDKTNIPEMALAIFADIALLSVSNLGPSVGMRLHTYGQPGRFRVKPYGFEYRTPSCVWLDEKKKAIPAQVCKVVHWALNHPDQAQIMYNRYMDRWFFSKKISPRSTDIATHMERSYPKPCAFAQELLKDHVGI